VTVPIKNARVAVAIAAAVEINRKVKALCTDLELLKATIRSEAEKASTARGDDNLVEFESDQGVATVCFPRDAVSPVPGANLRELQSVLPTTTWNHLFEEKVVLASDFSERFGALTKGNRATLKRYLEWSPRAPRVTLPK
jgi:hypothetical protein